MAADEHRSGWSRWNSHRFFAMVQGSTTIVLKQSVSSGIVPENIQHTHRPSRRAQRALGLARWSGDGWRIGDKCLRVHRLPGPPINSGLPSPCAATSIQLRTRSYISGPIRRCTAAGRIKKLIAESVPFICHFYFQWSRPKMESGGLTVTVSLPAKWSRLLLKRARHLQSCTKQPRALPNPRLFRHMASSSGRGEDFRIA
jgi:hypothetical protein